MEVNFVEFRFAVILLLHSNVETLSQWPNKTKYELVEKRLNKERYFGALDNELHPDPRYPIYITPENADEIINRLSFSSMQELRLRKKPFTFVVEGIVGAGKTTMLSTFQKYPYIDVLPEPVDKWTNLEGIDMLNLALTNPRRWGLAQEMYGVLTVLDEHLRSVGLIRGMERSVHSARFIFTEAFWMMGQMSNVEYTILDNWYRLLNNEMKKSPTGFDLTADLIVYLQTDPKTALNRIKDRGRPEEKGIQLSFLESLHSLHENWLIHKNGTHSDNFPAKMVIVINTTENLEMMMEVYEKFADRIWNIVPGELKSICYQQTINRRNNRK